MYRRSFGSLLGLVCILVATEVAGELLAPPADSDAAEIARRAEDSMRSARTIIDAEMIVVSPRLASARVMRFQSWEERDSKRSFIRILSPAKDAGTGFLKLHPNLWMYIPRCWKP